MQKLTAKKIIEFRRLSPRSKQTYANNLKKPIVKGNSGGGDYWIRCISAISNACKENDRKFIQEKIEEIIVQLNVTTNNRTKVMYQRNIDILSVFEGYDFSKLKPKRAGKISTLNNPKNSITVKGLSIQVFPNYVFTYLNGNTNEIGAIWFVAQLGGYHIDELQIFSELLFKYLSANYSKKYTINSKFCTVVDIADQQIFKHSSLLAKGGYSNLSDTLSELQRLLK